MMVATLRLTYDRKEGKELDRQILDPAEMPDMEYAKAHLWATTGMTPKQAAQDFLAWMAKQNAKEDSA